MVGAKTLTIILVVEFKVGATSYQPRDIQQVEDYALDLRDFHEGSHHLPIVPVLCSTDAERPTDFDHQRNWRRANLLV
jgi:hypothetical protein